MERLTRRTLLGEMVAELTGTLILILFGVGVVAQAVTGKGALGDHDSIAWAWGLGVTFGVYTAGRISGAHLNPAVTVALAAFSDFSWRKVLPFALSQTLVPSSLPYGSGSSTPTRSPTVDPKHTIATQGILHPPRQWRDGRQHRHRVPRPDPGHRDPVVPGARRHRRPERRSGRGGHRSSSA